MLGPLVARGTRLATDYAEATKRRAKAAACEANNFDFMTWASSTRGGIGHEAAAWFTTNFDAKMALASSDSERWRVSGERKRFLQVHSAIHCEAQRCHLRQQRVEGSRTMRNRPYPVLKCSSAVINLGAAGNLFSRWHS